MSSLLPLSRRAVRVWVGALWLVDAALQAQPHFFTRAWFTDDLAQSVMAQPQSINRSIYWVIDRLAPAAAVWNTLFVVVQATLGLALLAGRFERMAIAISVGWALGIWWVGEGFGRLPTGFAMLADGSPGPVLLYPLLALLAWPSARRGPSMIATRTGIGTWVALWAGQAVLHLPFRYPVGLVLQANVQEHSLGQPGWLLGIAHGMKTLSSRHGVGLSVALAVLEVAVGAGVLVRRWRRAALGFGIVISLIYWVVFQYFGGLFGGGATDPGSAPLLILLALGLWPARPPDPARESVRHSDWQAGVPDSPGSARSAPH